MWLKIERGGGGQTAGFWCPCLRFPIVLGLISGFLTSQPSGSDESGASERIRFPGVPFLVPTSRGEESSARLTAKSPSWVPLTSVPQTGGFGVPPKFAEPVVSSRM